MSVHCSSPATAAVDDAGADAAADAADAGGHHGQDDKGEDGPDPPARPALPLRPTGSNIGSALLLAGARPSPEAVNGTGEPFLGILKSSSSFTILK